MHVELCRPRGKYYGRAIFTMFGARRKVRSVCCADRDPILSEGLAKSALVGRVRPEVVDRNMARAIQIHSIQHMIEIDHINDRRYS